MITNFISKSLEFIGTVEPSFAAITTPLKRSGNSYFITSNVVSSV